MAKHGINSLQPDIVFLDINMPEMTGIDFVKSFVGKQLNIIFTTAHQQYAIEGFECDAIDYLLKPIAFDRFMKAVYKVEQKLHFNPQDAPPETPPTDSAPPDTKGRSSAPGAGNTPLSEFFMVKVDKKLVKITIAEVVYVEGMKDYVKIHLTDHFVITHMTMTKMMSLLPEYFIRINRSFIIQMKLIKHMEGNLIEMSNGDRLTIGVNYRNAVKEKLNDWTV